MNAPKQILRGLIFTCILAAAAVAQDAGQSSDSARDANEGVYVRDSAVATEKLALADRLEHLQEWGKSADVYQELLQQFADRVAPSGKDKNDRIDQYTSVANIVQDKLSHWPADGTAMCSRPISLPMLPICCNKRGERSGRAAAMSSRSIF